MIFSTTDADFRLHAKARAIPPYCSIYRSGDKNNILLISAKLHKGVLFGAGKVNLSYNSDKNTFSIIPTTDGKISVIYSAGPKNKERGSQIIALNTFLGYCNITEIPYGKHPAILLPDGSIEVDLNNLI